MDGAAGKTSYRSSVDSSRPFSSVKEAVAIFGERILVGEVYHSTPSAPAVQPMKSNDNSPSWKSSSMSPSESVVGGERGQDDGVLVESVRRLEAELEETKAAMRELKQQGSEMEIALASLNAELHLNMAKMARAEAAAAKKAAEGKEEGGGDQLAVMRMVSSPTLAQILNLSSEMNSGGGFYSKTKAAKVNAKKKKPVVPLVGDFLYWRKKKKDSSSALSDNPIYGSPDIF